MPFIIHPGRFPFSAAMKFSTIFAAYLPDDFSSLLGGNGRPHNPSHL
jgi:hypothetical protein